MNTKRRSGLNITFRLLGLVKPLMGIMFLAIFMGTLGFLTAIFIPVFGAYALVDILGINTILSLKTITISVLIFALLRGILRYAEQAANHHIAFKLLAIIRDYVFKSLRRLAPAKLESKDKGNLIAMITTDIELIEVFYAHTISPVAIAFIISVIMTSYLASINPIFGLIALLAYLTVGILIPMLISKIGAKAGTVYRDQVGKLSSTVLDSLRGLREVLQFNYGLASKGAIKQQTLELNKSLKDTKNYEGLTNALVATAIMTYSLIILFVGINLYSNNSIGFDGLVIAFVAMISSFGPVVALANLSNNLIQTFAAADRVLDILDEEPITKDITNQAQTSFGDIEINDLSFAYDQEVIIDQLDLSVESNQVLGLSGKSGSGKSTILRLLMRFWDSDSGSININNKSIKEINTSDLRKMESFVTQDTSLFNKSVIDNIKISNLDASLDQVIEAAKKASIHDFIETLPQGYETIIGELGSSLSGGERQRIGLARAFLHDAPLLLLDEPTSNLDSLNEGIILKSINDEKENKTIILVSHREKTLSIADKIINLESERSS